MFAQDQNIHRRPDGSIDVDFYRQEGLMERRVVLTGFFKGIARMKKGLVAVAILAIALYVAPSRDGAGWNGSAISNGLNSATLIATANVKR